MTNHQPSLMVGRSPALSGQVFAKLAQSFAFRDRIASSWVPYPGVPALHFILGQPEVIVGTLKYISVAFIPHHNPQITLHLIASVLVHARCNACNVAEKPTLDIGTWSSFRHGSKTDLPMNDARASIACKQMWIMICGRSDCLINVRV